MSQRILIVRQSRAGGTDQLVHAFAGGVEMVGDELEKPIELSLSSALETGAADVLGCAAIVVATPEHFGSMAGATKHFFEEIWHHCIDRTRGLPWQLLVKAGNDGQGTIESVQRLVTGLGWSEFRPPLLVVGDVDDQAREAAAELGATLALSLDAGLA